MRAALLGVLVVCSAARGLSGQVFAATLSPGGSGKRSSATRAAAACAVDSVGLIDPATGQWNVSSCLEVDWADDAETASVLADGTVLVYVTPSGGEDTFFARVDFGNRSVTKAIVGGDQGNLRCTPAGRCSPCRTRGPRTRRRRSTRLSIRR